MLRVGFSVRVRVGYGDTVLVTGSHPSLGEWDVSHAVPLTWSQDGDGGDVWHTVVQLPEHFVVRFKVRHPWWQGPRCCQPPKPCLVGHTHCCAGVGTLCARSPTAVV